MTIHSRHLDEETLASVVSDDADDATLRPVRHHLEECSDCAARARDLVEIADGLRDLGQAHRRTRYPGDLAAKFAEGRAERARARRYHWWQLAAAAAAVVVVVSLTVWRPKHTLTEGPVPGILGVTRLTCPGSVPGFSRLADLRPSGSVSLSRITFRAEMPARPPGRLVQPRLDKKGDKV